MMGAVALEPALVSMTCCKDENCAGAADGGLPESDKADVAAVSPALLLKITRDRRRREKKKVGQRSTEVNISMIASARTRLSQALRKYWTYTIDAPRATSTAALAWMAALVASLSLRLVWLAEESRRALGCEPAALPRLTVTGLRGA